MQDEFLAPSEKAVTQHSGRFVKKHNFPFDLVPVGMSFMVKKDEIKSFNSLKVIASRKGIELGRVFKVVNHGEVYEVFFARERP